MEHYFSLIKGWFDFGDLYTKMVKQARDGMLFVELGVWKGCSAAYMGVEIVNSGKSIRFDVIDNFQGLHQEHKSERANFTAYRNNYQECLQNLLPLPFIRVIGLPAPMAAALYAEGSIDFLFIDANHDYEHVKADINLWLPKIKPGGIIAGHDYINFPGVKRAVDELLPDAEQCSERSWKYNKPL